MIFNEKKIPLKNGATAVFKSPEIEDAKEMLDYIKTACGETDFLARYPEEWDSMSVENEKMWIQNSRNSKNTQLIACYVENRIVGNCEIRFLGGKKVCHRATVAIAILKSQWGLGIGTAMMKELIASAEEHKGTKIIELEFIEGNDRARALYEKLGFCIVGERPNAFKLKNGSIVKEYFMQKEIESIYLS